VARSDLIMHDGEVNRSQGWIQLAEQISVGCVQC
jgi:hypothetical protein